MKKGNNKDDWSPIGTTTLWMVTFGDLLMLLLTFFVLLLAMSSMDVKSLRNIFSVFVGAAGPLEFCDKESVKAAHDIVQRSAGGVTEVPDLDKIGILRDQYFRRIKGENDIGINNLKILEDMFTTKGDPWHDQMPAGLQEFVGMSEDERGVIITLQEMVLFSSGEAEIKLIVFPLLDWLAEVLDSIPNDVFIMGHTDNVPIRKGLYRSNWELSLYRALNVHNYFVEKKGLSPERIAVGGYGDLRPRFPNNIKEGRRKNRRVEIIIKKTRAELRGFSPIGIVQ